MAAKQVSPGQKFQKADGTDIVFEVVDLVDIGGLPHARMSDVLDPSDIRVVSVDALYDRRHFRHAADGALPRSGTSGRLRLAMG
ncbi:MAG: hypothetical protein HOH66_09325 [Rhodospirillaceae bacterium]|nr:hypothetical protein [Rhodospirillaceae bacterium]MBT6118054.1 hypothetical protein [Rhodospirillaceae bacterium]